MGKYHTEIFEGEAGVKDAIEFLHNQSKLIIRVEITHDGPCYKKQAPPPPPPVTSDFAQSL